MKLLLTLVKKALAGIVMILIVSSFTFFLVRMIPGNPVKAKYFALVQKGMTPYQANIAVRSLYGFLPHQPLLIQYFQYMHRLLRFDLGKSISYTGEPVTKLLLTAMPWTLWIVTIGIVVSFVLGVMAGVIAGMKRTTRLGGIITWSSTFLHSIPNYMLGVVLIYVFSTLLGLLPVGSPYNSAFHPGLNSAFIGSLLRHLALPLATYVISGYGGWMLTMKSSVISVLGDDFILASELRGMKPSLVLRYVARNAFLPLFTGLTLSLGFMFGGSVLIENIFDIPGLGNLLVQSTGALDYPLMEGCFILITAAVIVANIISDLVYSLIDPRVKGEFT